MEKSVHTNITVTHMNIRESISILLFRIVALDFLAAIFSISFFSLVSFGPNHSFSENILSYNTLFFVLLGLLKIFFTIYIVLLWLNEYYELTPTAIIHKKGILWRDEKRYQFEYVRTIKMDQGILGKIFNYGTIELYDIRRNKRIEMYLIHNPRRYVHILEHLIDNPHEETHELHPHFFAKDYEEDKELEEK